LREAIETSVRKAWALLSICLAGVCHLPMATAEPTYGIHSLQAVAPVNQAFVVQLDLPSIDSGPSVLQNGAFDQGFASWQRTTRSLGQQAIATVESGTALLLAHQPTGSDNIAVSQVMAPLPQGPYRLAYRALDEGTDASTFVVLLRETFANGTFVQTQFTHLASASWSWFNWTWTPKAADAKTLTVLLQVSIQKGLTQQVRYDDVSLSPIPTVTWSVPGGRLVSQDVLGARVQFAEVGTHVVYANGTDSGVGVWTARGSIEVGNTPPQARLVQAGRSEVNLPMLLDASLSVDVDAPLRLDDEGFDHLGSTWFANGKNVAAAGFNATRTSDGVHLDVVRASKDGSVSVSQSILVGHSAPAFLVVSARDQGDLDAYAFLFREANATATAEQQVVLPPVGAAGKLLVVPWSPQLRDPLQLTLFLRFRMVAGASAQVTFEHPRLLAGLDFSWSVDGAPVKQGNDPTFTYLTRVPGAHRVDVTVTDEEGARDNASEVADFLDAGYVWPALSALLPLVPATDLKLSEIHRVEGSEEQIANGEFAAGKEGWTLNAAEVGGEATWDVRSGSDGSFAHLSARAQRSGSVAIQQNIGRTCLEVPCTFSFEARGTAPLEVLLIERNTTDSTLALRVNRISAPLSGAWHHFERPWVLDPGSGRATVYLRFLVSANTTASADFRSVSLQPALDIKASATGAGRAVIANGTLSVSEPGPYDIHVAVSNPYGQVGNFDRAVNVLPVGLFPTGQGLAVWAAPGEGTISLENESGDFAWSFNRSRPPAPAGAASFSFGDRLFVRLPDGNGTVVLSSNSEDGRFPLVDLRDRFTGPLLDSNATVHRSGWATSAAIRIATLDDAILNGTAKVYEEGRLVGSAPLVRNGQALVASVPLPLDLRRHSYVVQAVLVDGWGTTLSAPQTTLEVGVNPVLIGSLVFLPMVLLVAVIGWSRRLILAKRAKRGP